MRRLIVIPLLDQAPYYISTGSIVSCYVASSTTFNVLVVNSETPITFVHEADTKHLVFSKFVEAFALALSSKTVPETIITMEVPAGFTIDLG